MSTPDEQIARLEAAIAAQEGLRPVLGDQAVDAIIAAARAQLAALRATPSGSAGAMAAGDVLAEQLHTLLTADLIRQAEPPPELEYLFRHSLLQEATYGSMLNSQRQTFHRQIGSVMEQLFANELEAHAATLALHFDAAGDAARALKYFTMAGDHDFVQSANAEAVGHYGRALELARRSRAPSPQLIHLGIRLGRAYELTNNYPRALVTYTTMQQWAAGRDDGTGPKPTAGSVTTEPEGADLPLRLAGMLAEAIAYGTPSNVHDPARASALSREALQLARAVGDPAAEAKALWNLMQVGFWTGSDPQQALIYGQESLAIARRHDLREQMGYTLGNLAGMYWGIGRFAEAQAMTEEARGLWQGLNNLSMLGDAYNMGAWTQFLQGNFDACHAEAGPGLQISQQLENHWNLAGARQVEGNAYFHEGRFADAIQSLRFAAEHCRLAHISAADTLSCLAETYAALGDRRQTEETITQSLAELGALAANFHGFTLGALARAQLTLGNVEAAAAIMRQAGPDAVEAELTWLEAPYRLALGWLAAAQARPAEAIRILDGLIPFLKQLGLGVYLYDAFFVRGQALLAEAEWAAAVEALDAARVEAETRGARRILWQIYAALAAAEQARGNPAAAERFRRLARAEVNRLTAQAGTPEQQALWLARPEVRSILAQTSDDGAGR